ncbi:MAG: heavy metal translocating P-type ATPase [Planctomycetes bacterium]|nr:heavy metal translocating P-type ATPase [Planctomycetota bacterium]
MSSTRGACLHCGLPLRGPPGGEGDAFCCFGCELAWRVWGGDGSPGTSLRGSLIARVMLAAFLSMASMMFSLALYASAVYPAAEGGGHALGPLAPVCRWLAFAFAAPVLPLLGWPLVSRGAARLDGPGGSRAVDALIATGVLAAFALSAANLLRGEGEVYFETASMTLVLLTLGRYLDAQARHQATTSVRELLSTDAEGAWRLPRGPGGAPGGAAPERVAAGELRAGDAIRVLAGERVPADGEVLAGSGALDESLLTGEAEPRRAARGDWIHAGSVLAEGAIDAVVRRAAGDRLLDRMVAIVESARERRMPLERLSASASRWFLPVAVAVAAGTVLSWGARVGWTEGVLNGLAVLLVSCPCALGIATPLAAWTAIGRAARRGILVRSGDVFERLERGGRVFLDKTGTLTSSRLEVERVVPAPGVPENEVLRAAASLAALSRHPASEAVRRHAAARGIEPADVEALEVHAGLGLSGRAGGETVRLGSRRFVESSAELASLEGTAGEGETEVLVEVLVAKSGRALGAIVLREELRPEAAEVARALAGLGFEASALTGDRPERGRALERRLGLPVAAGLLPHEKVERLERARERSRTTVMVGDGVNDAPVLAAADVGIALSSGADLARDAADVVLLDRGEPLRGLVELVQLSRRTVRRIRFNLFWSFAYNAAGMGLAAAGIVHPIVAAALMIASSLLVVAGSVTGTGAGVEAGERGQGRPEARAPGAPRAAAAARREESHETAAA